jgi:pimeloyl-ACP methyl ester carboxylesterase
MRLVLPGRLVAATLGLLVLCGLSVPASAAATVAVRCRAVAEPVTVTGIGQATVAGTLCAPAGRPVRTIEVLVSGLSYDRIYWELPPAQGVPGYQQSVAQHGYAALALDRLGTGASTRPPAATLTYSAELDALHQVISAVRAGAFGSYRNLVLVGHSYGSGLSVGEAGSYHDVDALVLSGWAHSQGSAGLSFYNALVDAGTDPVTGPTDPPAGYLTTRVGTRAGFFDAPGDASPAVELADEATKSTLTQQELATITDAYDPSLAARVDVPVLVAIGQHDVLTCGVPLTCSSSAEIGLYESALFTGSPGLTGYLLPGAGHSINLAANAADWYQQSVTWTGGLGF